MKGKVENGGGKGGRSNDTNGREIKEREEKGNENLRKKKAVEETEVKEEEEIEIK